MSQQYSQGTNNFVDSQTNPTQPWQKAQPTVPGDFGAAPTQQQRFDNAGRQGDGWDENVDRRQGVANQYASSTGPTDVYASHAGQLGATGEGYQFDSIVGSTAGQDGQAAYAGGREPVPPPPAVPQPGANAVQPSTSDKLMGNAEKLAGKISGNERLVERGQARKSGTLNTNPGQF